MKKFIKKDLIKKLGMSEECANVVMKAQKEFPELLTSEGEGFVMDGQKLCKELGVKDNFNTWLLGETRYDKKGNIKSQGKLIKYRCVENEDYITDWDSPNAIFSNKEIEKMTPQKRSAYGITNKITLTLRCAKKIAMKQNNERGDLVCDYFIYLEEAMKDMNNWIIVREPQKEGYKSMTEAINKQYKKNHNGKEANFFIYSNNADMINLCLFGYKSKQMKTILDIEYKEPLRDNIVCEANKALYELQQLNESLIISNIDFQTRKIIIQNNCNEKYLGIRIKVVSEFSEELKDIKVS